MNKVTAVFRPSINENELAAMIYDLELTSTNRKLEPDTVVALGKLKLLAVKAGMGLAKPSYINTGREQANTITLEKLGGYTPEVPANLTKLATILDRRHDNEPIRYTPEEKMDAEFASADHFVLTGEKKDFKEFLKPKEPTVTVPLTAINDPKEIIDIEDANNITDADIFKNL